MSRNALFLSGWEYNRVLQKNPTTPIQSALPAEALWNGAAQFWLFENIYCTNESLEGEIAATETLGWATGYIFQDLQKRGFLKVFDWKKLKNESPLQYQSLIEVHKAIRERYDEKSILHLLTSGNDVALEAIKLELLKPILDHLHCINNISPNSIRKWINSKEKEIASPSALAIQHLVNPLIGKRKPIRAGTQLCNAPGTGVSEEARSAQKFVEETIQMPMIPDLLAGRLPQKDYHKALLPTAKVYRPINNQLLQDYQVNISRLEYLRDIASHHLWKNLHEEWIPELEHNPKLLGKFDRRIKDALARSYFDPYLEYVTTLAIAIVATSVGGASLAIAPLVGFPSASTSVIAGAATGQVLAAKHADLRKKSDELTLFFQKAKRV